MNKKILKSSIYLLIMFIFACTSVNNISKFSNTYKANNKIHNSYYYYWLFQKHLKKKNINKALGYIKQAIKTDPNSQFLKDELAFYNLNFKKKLAWYNLKKGKVNIAIATFEDILQEHPNDLETLIVYGKLMQTQNNKEKAKQSYEKVLINDPKQKDIYLLLGLIYIEDKEFKKAYNICLNFIKYYPNSYIGHYLLGKIYLNQNKNKQAVKQFLKTIELKPNVVEPRLELIKLYKKEIIKNNSTIVTIKSNDTISLICLKLYKKFNKQIELEILKYNPKLKKINDLDIGQKIIFPNLTLIKNNGSNKIKLNKIKTLYKEILSINPDNTFALTQLGYLDYKNGNKKDAKKIFKILGEKSINDKNVMRTIFKNYFEKNDFDASKIILEQMLKTVPKSSDIRYLTGAVYDKINNINKAIFHYKKVNINSQFYQSSVLHTALLYRQHYGVNKAIKFLEKIISNDKSDNIEFVLYLSLMYEEENKLNKAEKILEKAIKIAPQNSKLHYRLGVIYDKLGNKNNSISQMKKVINLDPKNANALNYLGYTYAELGQNLNEAELLINKALKYKPDDGFILDSLGWVYFKKGNYEKAITFLENAVDLLPNDPMVLEHLGDAYVKVKKMQEALNTYKRSLNKRTKDKESLQRKIKKISEKHSNIIISNQP